MNGASGCSVDLLAQGDVCAVGRCRYCGAVHLNLRGRMALRIHEETLRDMAETLLAAVQCLDAWPAEPRAGIDVDAQVDLNGRPRH